MGSIVKGVASLFGGKARRREQRAANRGLNAAQASQDAFKFSNVYEGLQGPQFGGYQAVQGQAAQLGDPAQAELAQLADAQGYTAAQTNIAGLQRGADTGLTNTMRNLQVSTAGAEMAAQEADQSLAASQDLAAQAGTGAGGATALAAAAAKSKAGIAADIDRQVKQNELLRAQGESELQRSQLAQQNLASQFDLGQQQFNVGAQNEAARFGASAANQFALAEFGAANQMSQFNVGAQNQFAMSNVDAQNRFGMANMQAQNEALKFGAQSANQQAQAAFDVERTKREFDFKNQQLELQKLTDQTDRALARKQNADAARAQAKADLIGGIGGVASALVGGLGGAGEVVGAASKGFNIKGALNAVT
jgi:hypothetical protein